MSLNTLEQNLAAIRARITRACMRVGRDSSEIQLMGVTKTVSIERVRDGITLGIALLGENYIQEARKKMEILADLGVSWHFIGHLQTNKAKLAVDCFDCIQTVDRERLALELDRHALKLGKRIPVLIEVNVGQEETKNGVLPENLPEFFQSVCRMNGLSVRGLMSLPPYLADPEDVRPYFKKLRQLLSQLRDTSPQPEDMTVLSMGMSHDFDVAIEEGATLIRIGTALFGTRCVQEA